MTNLDLAFALWMGGVSAAHGARFFLFKDSTRRKIVAAGGVLVYGTAAVLCLLSHPMWAYGIAALFPIVGISIILIGMAVARMKSSPAVDNSVDEQVTGTDEVFRGSGIDHWQLAVGFTQFPALFFATFMLIKAALVFGGVL